MELKSKIDNISEIIKKYSFEDLKDKHFILIDKNINAIKKEIAKKYNISYFDVYVDIGGNLFIYLFYIKSFIKVNLKNNNILYNKYLNKNNEKLSFFEYPLSIDSLIEIIDNEFTTNNERVISNISKRFEEISLLDENWNNEGACSFHNVANSIEIVKEDIIKLFKDKKISKELYFYPTIENGISIECEENQNDIEVDFKNNKISFFNFDIDDNKEKDRDYTKENLEYFITKL